MPTPTVKLYPNEHIIHLIQTDHGVRYINMPYGEDDFRVHKNATTPVQFVVRDNDRKPIDLTDKALSITIMDHDNRNMMMEKPLEVLDAVKGKVKVDLLPPEVADWDPGYYNYSVLIENIDGTKNLLFVDQRSNATGWFELEADALPQMKEAINVGAMDTWTPHLDGEYPDGTTQWKSSAIPGDAKHNFNDGLHTIAVYLKDYTGKLWIQGSLEESVPSLEADWFDIHLTTNQFELLFTEETSIEPFNFRTNVNWIRVLTEPDEEWNRGTIEKVLIKI